MKKHTVLAALFTLLLCCTVSHAETLEEFKNELVKYQQDPYARAMELKKLNEDALVQHEKIFKQINLPFESLLEYETTLAGSVNYYLSTYYFERQDRTSDNTILDPETLNKLIEQKPPYTFSYYLEVINSAEVCRSVIKTRTGYINKYAKLDEACRKRRGKLEKDFRVLTDKLNNETDNLMETGWKLKLTKAQIEECVAKESFCRIAKKSRLDSINELKGKVATLEELLKKIRSNVVSSNANIAQLNEMIENKRKQIFDTLEMLNNDYDIAERILNSSERNISDFERYCNTSEQSLIDSEVLLLLNLNEHWAVFRRIMRALPEIWVGKEHSKAQIENAKKGLIAFNEKLMRDRDYCINVQLTKINSVELNAQSLFGSSSISLSGEDAALRTKFLERLQQYKKRSIQYLEDMMRQISYNNSCLAELDIITASASVSGGKNRFAEFSDKLVSLRDFEVFHFDDYPATLGRVIAALLVMCIGLFSAFSLDSIISRKFIRHSTKYTHTTIVLAVFVKYFILLIFALVTLSILRLPLTALTFAGGALAVAFGFGAQRVMADVICGISILMKSRLRVGDHVIFNNQYGIVQEISLRDTVLTSEDSNLIVVPNSKLFDNEFVNLTLSGEGVRTTVELSVACNSDLNKVRSIAYSVLENSSLVLKKPYYRVLCNTLGDWTINIQVQFFCNVFEHDLPEIRSTILEELLNAFRKNGIEVPVPQYDVHIKKTDS